MELSQWADNFWHIQVCFLTYPDMGILCRSTIVRDFVHILHETVYFLGVNYGSQVCGTIKSSDQPSDPDHLVAWSGA